jgi:hypothetical protein
MDEDVRTWGLDVDIDRDVLSISDRNAYRYPIELFSMADQNVERQPIKRVDRNGFDSRSKMVLMAI